METLKETTRKLIQKTMETFIEKIGLKFPCY